MKLVINTAHQRIGGAVQVALSFIEECRRFPENEYYVWVGPGVRKALDETDFPANFHFQHFDFGVINLQKTFTINRMLREKEEAIKPDCIIATSGPSYFHSHAPQIMGYNLPLYIYPESPHIRSLSFHQRLRMALKKRMHFYFFKRDAHAFVVQTEDVNQRIRRALGRKEVFTVSNTHNAYYNNWKKLPPKLPPRSVDEFRFITISSYYKHKNLELIPAVLQELQRRGLKQIKFVLTLQSKDFEAVFGSDHNGQLINVGPVQPAECPSLYAECDALFLPTLAECFSASYPEAMTMEKPIVTTDLGFARSICEDAALYFEPKNEKAAADAIEHLLENTLLQKELISKGKFEVKRFDTPEQRAEKYLKLCEKYAGVSKNLKRAKR